MKPITCEQSEAYDRSKMTVGAFYSPLYNHDGEHMTEWGTKGDSYTPIIRDYVTCAPNNPGKIIACKHYSMGEEP